MAEAGHPGSAVAVRRCGDGAHQLPGSDGHPRTDRDRLDRRVGGGGRGGYRRRDPGCPVNRAIHAGRTGRPRARGLLAGLALVAARRRRTRRTHPGRPAAPRPISIPAPCGGPQSITDQATCTIVTAWLARAALLVAWIAWAWLTICVAAEIRAWISGTDDRPSAGQSFDAVDRRSAGRHRVRRRNRRQGFRSTNPCPSGCTGTRPRKWDWPATGPDLTTAAPLSEGTLPDVGGSRGSGCSPMRRLPPAQRSKSDTRRSSSDTHAEDTASSARHLVSSRETLWSIAEDRLGDARRWRDIADLNYSVDQPDGSRLTSDHWILPGWELLLPGRWSRERRGQSE